MGKCIVQRKYCCERVPTARNHIGVIDKRTHVHAESCISRCRKLMSPKSLVSIKGAH